MRYVVTKRVYNKDTEYDFIYKIDFDVLSINESLVTAYADAKKFYNNELRRANDYVDCEYSTYLAKISYIKLDVEKKGIKKILVAKFDNGVVNTEFWLQIVA